MSWSDRVQSRWDSRMRARGSEIPLGEPVVVDVEVFIERSAQAIWDAMEDPLAVARPIDELKRVEPVEGTGPGVGRQVTLHHEQDGRPLLQVRTVTDEFPPAYSCAVVDISPGRRTREQCWIEHTGAGCRVRWQVAYPCTVNATENDRALFATRQRAQLLAVAERWKRLLETGSL